MKLPVLVLGCLLAGAVSAQTTKHEMWAWKDANGVTHYSDRPVPGAKRIEVATMTPENSPGFDATPAAANAPSTKPPAAAAYEYQLLEIWSPENGQTYFGADAVVSVRIRSEPELGPGHQLRFYLDGKLDEAGASSYDRTLSGIERGAHSMVALIVDEKGNEKIRSAPVVFHIRQPGLNSSQNVGPALKPPPPKPTPKGG